MIKCIKGDMMINGVHSKNEIETVYVKFIPLMMVVYRAMVFAVFSIFIKLEGECYDIRHQTF